MKSTIIDHSSAFLLKGSLFTLSLIQLLQADPRLIGQQLEKLTSKSPNFFKNAPIVIDLEKIMGKHDNIDFVQIKAELEKFGLFPIGVRYGTPAEQQAAIAAGLGILAPSKAEKSKEASQSRVETKIISQPIRSGQQIISQADLVILGSVSAGAEILAGGNIHIYGTLRGRAIAGTAGNQEARIFCHKLEAELISIAGVYKLNEDWTIDSAQEMGIQVLLEEGKLVVRGIS